MITPRWAASVAVALVATVLVSAAPAAAPDFSGLRLVPYTPPKAAPAFSLPDADGKLTSLADLKGHLVLVFFWTTW